MENWEIKDEGIGDGVPTIEGVFYFEIEKTYL